MGLVLIVSILMPIILGVAGFLVARQIVSDIESAARGPIGQINARLDEMKATLNSASQAFQGLSGSIASIVSTLGEIGNAIGSLTTSIGPIDVPNFSVRIPVIDRRIDIPVPDIPSFTLPGLTQLRSMLSRIANVFDRLTGVIQRISAISSLPQQLNGIVAELMILANNVGEIANRWLSALSLIALVLLIWVSATYVALVYRWLSSGWRMLRGLPSG